MENTCVRALLKRSRAFSIKLKQMVAAAVAPINYVIQILIDRLLLKTQFIV